MKELYNALRDFVKQDFNWSVYGLTALFLSAAIFINYSSTIDINPFGPRQGVSSRLLYYGTLFGGTYFVIALISVFSSEKNYLKDWRFWTMAIAFVFIAMIPKLSYSSVN